MVDKDQLHADVEATCAEIAERERQMEEDPIAAHDAIMAATRVTKKSATAVIHKTRQDARVRQSQPYADNNGHGDNLVPPFTDEQMDTMASVLVEIREETQSMIDTAIAPLRERIANLEGQLSMLTSMMGNGNGKAFEASEVVRKLKVTPR